MVIDKDMHPFYRTYFGPIVKVRPNLIGAVQFQSTYTEHVTTRLLQRYQDLQAKCRVEPKSKAREDAETKRHKIMVIFNEIRDAKYRYSNSSL